MFAEVILMCDRRGEKWSYQMIQEYHPICKKEYYIEEHYQSLRK